MFPTMAKASFSLTSDPSPFPSLLLLILIFTFHMPPSPCRFFSSFPFPRPALCYNCAGHFAVLCKPILIAKSSAGRGGRCGWVLRTAPVALLVAVSWLTQKDSAGVATGKLGSQCRRIPAMLGHCMAEHDEEAEEIGGWTPWVLVGMILLLFIMAQRQTTIRHCLFV